jgi:hypothetical protein
MTFVFPQDFGTGHYPVNDGSGNDAANFGAAFHAIGFTDFVAAGLALTPDYGVPDVDIAAGSAVISDTSADTPDGDTRSNVSYLVQYDGTTGVNLTDNATNHVFLVIHASEANRVDVVVNTDGAVPSSGPALKIGTVNTLDNSVAELNRGSLDGMSGTLADPQEPTEHGNEKHSASYVASDETGKITVSSTIPSSPSVNDIWIDSSNF